LQIRQNVLRSSSACNVRAPISLRSGSRTELSAQTEIKRTGYRYISILVPTHYRVTNTSSQSDLASGEIASFLFVRGQHVLAGKFEPQNLFFTWGVENPHVTQGVLGPHNSTCQMASKSGKRLKQSARVWQTTDRQTTLQRNV